MTIDGYCTLGIDREFDLTASRLLSQLDRAGVDRAVVAPVDRCLAVDHVKGNDLVLAAAGEHGDRLIAACGVNPWFGAAAADELRRVAAAGAGMLVLHPAVQGVAADDELVWAWLEAAVPLRLPVYVHTGPPGHATPWQLVTLAERYPTLDFVMGHSGATDYWNDVVPAARVATNVYLETSLARPFIVARHLAQVGYERGIMGSAAPLGDLEFEWQQLRAAVPAEALAQVGGGNLARLLAGSGGR